MLCYTYAASLVRVDTVNLNSPECPYNEKRKNYLVQNYLRSEKLLVVQWQSVAGVLEKPIGLIFKGQP